MKPWVGLRGSLARDSIMQSALHTICYCQSVCHMGGSVKQKAKRSAVARIADRTAT